jgi:hypothetical protein
MASPDPMEPAAADAKGRLVIRGIPDERTAQRVVELVCRNAAGATPEKVAAMLASLPCVLFPAIAASHGTRAAAALRALGADAAFLPSRAPGKEPAAPLPAPKAPPPGETEPPPAETKASAPRQAEGTTLLTDAPVLLLYAFLALLVSLASPVAYFVSIPLALYAAHRACVTLNSPTELRAVYLFGAFFPFCNACLMLLLLAQTTLSLRRQMKSCADRPADDGGSTFVMRLVAAPLLVALLLAAYTDMLPKSAGELVEGIESRLERLAARAGKELPRTVNENMRIDNVIAGPGKVLTYNCTLLKYNAGRINAARFRENMEGEIRKNVCSSSELKHFIDEDVRVAYAFSGNDGNPVVTVTVDPEDCRNQANKPEKGK